MKKRVLSALLVLALACGLVSTAWAAGEQATPESAGEAITEAQPQNAATPESAPSPMDGEAEADKAVEAASQTRLMAAPADDPEEPQEEPGGELVLNKWVEEADDGNFKLTLESYATGTNGTVVQKPTPLDIVLVLDESGSMSDVLVRGCDDPNKTDVDVTASGHLLESNASFPQGDRDEVLFVGHKVFADGLDTTKTYKVVYPEAASIDDATREIHYCPECNGWYSSTNHAEHSVIAKWVPFNESQNGALPTGEHTSAENWYYHVQFYEECGKTGRQVLQDALQEFLQSMKDESTTEDGTIIDNRVAIVGYGIGASYINLNGERAEVYSDPGDGLGGGPVAGSDTLAENAWSSVADLTEGDIAEWVNGVQANGSTPTHLGIQAAEIAFENAPETQDTDRAKVMILFTDGAPGANYVNFGPEAPQGTDWVTPAIQSAKRMKEDGVTIYSVGLFPSADGYDAENITYDVDRNGQGDEGFFLNANCFLHLVSSNYPNATGVDSAQWGELSGKYAEGTKSYYLGTSDAEELDEIFNQISEDVTPGQTTVTLDNNAVTRDTITKDFQIVDGTESVKAWTESYGL